MGRIISYSMENKIHVWNHQPVFVSVINQLSTSYQPVIQQSNSLAHSDHRSQLFRRDTKSTDSDSMIVGLRWVVTQMPSTSFPSNKEKHQLETKLMAKTRNIMKCQEFDDDFMKSYMKSMASTMGHCLAQRVTARAWFSCALELQVTQLVPGSMTQWVSWVTRPAALAPRHVKFSVFGRKSLSALSQISQDQYIYIYIHIMGCILWDDYISLLYIYMTYYIYICGMIILSHSVTLYIYILWDVYHQPSYHGFQY